MIDCIEEIKKFYDVFHLGGARYEQQLTRMAEMILNKECKFSDFEKAEGECKILILDWSLCDAIALKLFLMKYPDKKAEDVFGCQIGEYSEEYQDFVSQLD